MKPEEIAKKYVYGNHDARTDAQEVKDMTQDIEKAINDNLKKGTCFFVHKWQRWEQYEQPFRYKNGWQSFDLRQRRTCARCGKVQDVLIS